MELTITISTAEARSYPYRKVVFLADRAEVAELSCEGPASENVVFHEELFRRLLERHPELDTDAMFTPGWITQRADEAILYTFAAGSELEEKDADRLGQALREWCAEAGVRRLTISDRSRSAATSEVGADDWSLPDLD